MWPSCNCMVGVERGVDYNYSKMAPVATAEAAFERILGSWQFPSQPEPVLVCGWVFALGQ